MKKISIALGVAFALTIASCKDSDKNVQEENPNSTNGTLDPILTDSIHSNFTLERQSYIDKMKRRLDEMEADIEAARAKRKAERNAERIKEYDKDIELREHNRTTLKEKLDAAGRKTEAEWEKFKQEVDDYFKADKGRYNDTEK